MDRDGIVAELRQFKREYGAHYGILELGIFGSAARDELRTDSDVDVCVKTKTPDPFALVHVKAALEQRVHRPVDIVRVRERMNPYLKKRIEEEAQYV